MNCPTHKRCYPTEHIAIEALIQARIRFENNKAVTVYQCNDCNEWHLTSTGELNAELSKLLKSGEIKKQRDAMHWDYKLK